MPTIPSTWSTNIPITAHQLNQDMYTYDGSYFGANGVAFHSNRPISFETFILNSLVAAPVAGGAVTVLGGTQGSAISVVDNAALFGIGSDFPGDAASFQSAGAIGPGSNGIPGEYGGWNLLFSFIPLSTFSGTANTYGVLWSLDGSQGPDIGTFTQGSHVRSSCGFAVDLIQRISGQGAQIYAPAVAAANPSGSSRNVIANTSSTCGQTPRFGEVWMGVSNGNGLTVASVTTPIASITGTTPLSAATFNNTIQQTFNLLNNPPMLNCQVSAASTVPANTVTAVPFTITPLIDNYSGYSTAATNYTVPLPGIYFLHANIIFAESFNTGQCVSGIKVNATSFFGGSYNATPVAAQNTGASVTKVLDLQKGDTVSTFVVTSAGTNFGTANLSHFIMAWMAPISAVSNLTWKTPDVTGFQFQAGTPPGTAATQLAGLMNTKIANDINFVLNRPYLTVHQTTAQTSLVSNTFSSITMQSTVGLMHGSIGDNYGGWNVATNRYVAPVNGWYLTVEEINAATTATANSGNSVVAGFSVPTSGGVTSPTSNFGQPDWYQQLMVGNAWTYPTGSTGIGIYYLLAGETVAPSGMYQQTSGTWGTDVTTRAVLTLIST